MKNPKSPFDPPFYKGGKGGFLAIVLLFFSTPAYAMSPAQCLECHSEKSLTKEGPSGGAVSLYVNEGILKGSIHHGLTCSECHREIRAFPHPDKPSSVQCGFCHRPAQEDYKKSIHGKGFMKGDKDSPTCSTCHGAHDISRVKSPRARVYPLNLQAVCLKCHTDERIEARHRLPGPETIKAYEKSVHGRALKAGLNVAAVCSDCHGSHSIEPADDPSSTVNKFNIPGMCGKCHASIRDTYKTSIHGQAVEAGIKDAPVCTDCHGEHTISAVTDPASKVYATNIVKTCAFCHESAALQAQYGLPPKRLSTFYYSYHGIASTYGQVTVANCSSCHGVHDILSSTDPHSTIHPANLVKTCGKCHPGAGENFARGRVHIEAKKESSLGVFAVRTFYTWFIGILGAGFLLHVTLDIVGWLRQKKKQS